MLEILNLNENDCVDCYKCIRTCSVKAITFANNTAQILHEECILCGSCFVVCPQKAKQVRSDLNRVKEAIAAGKYVVCSLAPSFIADFRIESISAIEKAIKGLGFSDVQETAICAPMRSPCSSAPASPRRPRQTKAPIPMWLLPTMNCARGLPKRA